VSPTSAFPRMGNVTCAEKFYAMWTSKVDAGKRDVALRIK